MSCENQRGNGVAKFECCIPSSDSNQVRIGMDSNSEIPISRDPLTERDLERKIKRTEAPLNQQKLDFVLKNVFDAEKRRFSVAGRFLEI